MSTLDEYSRRRQASRLPVAARVVLIGFRIFVGIFVTDAHISSAKNAIVISPEGDIFLIRGSSIAIFSYAVIGLVAGVLIRGSVTAVGAPGCRKQVVMLGFSIVAALMSVIRADLTGLALLPIRIGPLLVIVWFLSVGSDSRNRAEQRRQASLA